jgi:hypothetical protein
MYLDNCHVRVEATKTTARIDGKGGTNFCLEDSLEKTYYFKFDAS